MASSNVPPVLTCWKDIAQYLGKGVRTVQRWEQDSGLPVRRPNGIDHKSPVAAHPEDLNTWLQTRWSARKRKSASKNPISADGASQSDSIPLTYVIQAAQDLRLAHRTLVAETSAALAALIRTCADLQEIKQRGLEARVSPRIPLGQAPVRTNICRS